jgi:hypothetical protein
MGKRAEGWKDELRVGTNESYLQDLLYDHLPENYLIAVDSELLKERDKGKPNFCLVSDFYGFNFY